MAAGGPTGASASPRRLADANISAICGSGTCLKPQELSYDHATATARFWSSALVRSGVVSHSPQTWAPLLAKLRAGQPITVFAIGSSIVESGAGCYASAEALARTGVSVRPPTMENALAATGACHSPGFVTGFMDAVNARWPHPGHLFVNAGRGGASMHSFSVHVCVDPWLPHKTGADLIIFENHAVERTDATAKELVHDVEHVYSHITLKTPNVSALDTPLLVVNVFPMSDTASAVGKGDVCNGEHGRLCGVCGEEQNAHFVERYVSANLPLAESALLPMAARYGWSSLSLHAAVLEGLKSGDAAALNWTSCEWINAWMNDRVHPSAYGNHLLSDMMTLLLGEAEVHVDMRKDETPLQRFEHSAVDEKLMLCVEGQQFHTTPEGSRDWVYVNSEKVNGHDVFKPGWISNVSGARLEVTTTTRLLSLPPETRLQLLVKFLRSYEHMGAVSMACVSGCECEPVVLQGHGSEQVSIEEVAATLVTQSGECALAFTVLAETLSGEHKAKIISLSIKEPDG